MQFLRCFSAPLVGIELPLPEKSADALMGVLLAPNAEQRSALFIAALRQSPSLVIWAVDCCLLRGITIPDPTLSALANGLVDDLPLVLDDSLVHSSQEELLSAKAVDAITIAVPATVDALEVSRRAVTWWNKRMEAGDANREIESPKQSAVVNAAAEKNSAMAAGACCLGLVHNITAYGSVTGSRTDGGKNSPDTVIANLKPYLGMLDSDVIRSAAEAVCHGSADWQQSRLAAQDPCAALQRLWMEEGTTATGLPVLTQTLCRLTRLESDFEAALEEAKLQAMYKLAAGAGHEINNPLGSIAGRAQLLLRDEKDPERRRTLAKINSQAFRAHEMISDMMLFARPPLPQFDQIAPVALIQSLVDEMHEITEQQEAEIVSHVTTDIATMRVDASQLRVALRAMCTNALEATGLGGRVEIRVSDGAPDKVLHKSSAAVQTVQITVCDNGPGFSDEERQHLFDPFYSGREAGRGLGFGLSKCWRIVRNHGGRIDVQSDPGRGATFEITLPVA